MTLVMLIAVAVAAGAPWLAIVAGMAVAVAPGPATAVLACVAVAVSVRRRTDARAIPEGDLFASLAGAVSAGASLRMAISGSRHPAVTRSVRRLCAVGAPISAIGTELGEQLPISGRRFAALCAMSERTGASIGQAMFEFAQIARGEDRKRRTRRAALAQARLSAWVVGAAPLCLTVLVLASRGLPEPGGAIVIVPMAVGATMQVAGMAVVFGMSARATR